MCYFVCLGLNGRIRLYQSRISYRRADQHSLSWTPQILIIYSDDQGGVWIICAEFERCWHGSNIETMGARTVSKRLGIIFWHATRSMRSLHCNGGENVERIWAPRMIFPDSMHGSECSDEGLYWCSLMSRRISLANICHLWVWPRNSCRSL